MSYSSARAASVEQLIGALRRYIICAAQWIEQLLQLTQSEDTNEKVASFGYFSIEHDFATFWRFVDNMPAEAFRPSCFFCICICSFLRSPLLPHEFRQSVNLQILQWYLLQCIICENLADSSPIYYRPIHGLLDGISHRSAITRHLRCSLPVQQNRSPSAGSQTYRRDQVSHPGRLFHDLRLFLACSPITSFAECWMTWWCRRRNWRWQMRKSFCSLHWSYSIQVHRFLTIRVG